MKPPAIRIALLLFGSGFCALAYQVAWLRLLRLTFGASTAASAAVLAVFMAGLGAGSLVLGRRVDGQARPLAFYAGLETGIAVAAALSPWLVAAARWAYIGLGGTAALGFVPGTALRLVLAALVLGVPTFLMGGTLPAVARAVEQPADAGRRLVALLYGANTLGAVCGALVTTFFALEGLGIQATIQAAAALNLLVAGVAFAMAGEVRAGKVPRGKRMAKAELPEPVDDETVAPAGPPVFVLTAAAVAGFVFLLMELVWYRMLSPILGGSSYTFGLILAVALLGVGVGGFVYAAGPRRRRPTLMAFSVTCALEALAIALPYALGDRIAVIAMMLQPIGSVSFALLVAAWFGLSALVVLPAAVVAGYQFPLLVALLGAGRRDVGREVGLAYACKTAGSILGSIAGGFGLLPLLSAPGAWRFAAATLLALAVVAWLLELASARRVAGQGVWAKARFAASPAVGTFAVFLLTTAGPSAVWRHTPTGAGGMPSSFAGPNGVRQMSRAVERAIVWEVDGRESSVAVHALDEVSLLINGKADGSALRDAPTQVMSGLVGAVLHPEARRALVIGLGTGSSAGWLAEVESIEAVDVVELEAATLEVARRCAPVNQDVLHHPKVRLLIGDGREHMLTAPDDYDLIFSEPSNPYRAGIASLFTEELYAAAASRLRDRGIFLQWLQGYQVDSQVVRTVLATMASVFPHVESWQVHRGDLLLVASRSPIEHDVGRIRRRVAQEPFRSALRRVLGVDGAEGFYTGFLASADLARAVLQLEGERLNTDDHPVVEFGFARSLGRDLEFNPRRLAALASRRGEHVPALRGGGLDWRRVLELRSARNARWGEATQYPISGDAGFDHRIRARNAYVAGDLRTVARHWSAQSQEPTVPIDWLMVAEAQAAVDDPRALEASARLEAEGFVVEAAAVRARYYLGAGRSQEALRELVDVFVRARTYPWSHRPTLQHSLRMATVLARNEPEHVIGLFDALSEPFAVSLLDEPRLRTRFEIVRGSVFETLCLEALASFEPHVPWEADFLNERHRCYAVHGHRMERRAREELEAFLRASPPGLE